MFCSFYLLDVKLLISVDSLYHIHTVPEMGEGGIVEMRK